MRVLVLGWEYPPAVAGGLGAACRGLTEGLAARGHRIVLSVPRVTGATGRGIDSDAIRRVPLDLEGDGGADAGTIAPLLSPYMGVAEDRDPAPGDAPLDHAGATRRLYGRDLGAAIANYSRVAVQRLVDERFDVIHAHDWMTVPAALRLRMATRRPVALHVHSTVFDRTGRRFADGPDSIGAVERAGVRTADRVITVSDYTRSVVAREYGLDPGRISVVHNGAPASTEGALAGSGAGRQDGPPTLLFLARLTRQKGCGFFLRAAARVHARRPDVRFVVAGDGDERPRLVERAAQLGIAHRTFFTGTIDDATRDRLYGEATAFVLTSVSEPFGLTPLEALRRGTPAVLCESSGVREVLPSAPSFAPWDAAGLADELVALVDDPERRAALVTAGLQELRACTWDASAEALERALQDTLDGAATRPSAWSERWRIGGRSA